MQEQLSANVILLKIENLKGEKYTERIQKVKDKQIINQKEIKGNLIRIVMEGDLLFLLFKNQKWACFEVICEYNSYGLLLQLTLPDIYRLWCCGIITREEKKEQNVLESKNREREVHMREIKELKRLQEKYKEQI